jgi:Cu2+-exporting ATPase
LRFFLAHDIPGRMRLRPAERLREDAGRDLRACLGVLAGDREPIFSPRAGSVLLLGLSDEQRRRVLAFFAMCGRSAAVSRERPRPRSGEAAVRVARNPIPEKLVTLFLPAPLRFALTVVRSLPYLFRGVRAFARMRLNLDALDGAALALCIVRRDFRALASITFFFALGEFLADWTRKKSRTSLEESLALKVTHVWVRENGQDRRILLAELRPGDEVVVRIGAVIPADGVVCAGEGLVNQSFMTGESLPVYRFAGDSVSAGTVVEQGEIVVRAAKVGGNTRINAILRCIEESEAVKALVQGKYERIADAIVPYNFLLSALVLLLTGDPGRAGSLLLVDYSCAIRLATPLAIFTAMCEAAGHGTVIKGGRFMEALARADAVVFDKTGTLTRARPVLAAVHPFSGRPRTMVLRLAACLEEHFVHPVGQAVVRAAEAENLQHREEHAQVEFVMAHGIASRWRDQRVLIGSRHFVIEDEHIVLSPEHQELIRQEADKGRSVLYLAIGPELAGLLFVEDALREEAAAVVAALRADGIRHIVMLTGDDPLTAQNIAQRAGIGEFRAAMLPEGKAAFVEELKGRGYTVLMVGDGINDSPALAVADVGAAMGEGADLAREVADIVLTRGELGDLLRARHIARQALERVRKNFLASLAWNSLFLAGGLLGVLGPGVSALLHNATTTAIALSSLNRYLPQRDDP